MEDRGMMFKTLRVEVGIDGIALLTLNRPSKANAVDHAMFTELGEAVAALDSSEDVRVVILSGAGENFCAGIDLSLLKTMPGEISNTACEGRMRETFRRKIKWMQAAFTSMEECRKPVIAAIHGACIGAGIDLITACDLRYCTADARFAVKEVDLAITADLGTLQRLPGIVGEGVARELALTARTFNGDEARAIGLVHATYTSRDTLLAGVRKVALGIAAKSPLAIIGTKAVLLHARDHAVKEGLDYVATWNSAMLLSSDLQEAWRAIAAKQRPVYSKL